MMVITVASLEVSIAYSRQCLCQFVDAIIIFSSVCVGQLVQNGIQRLFDSRNIWRNISTGLTGRGRVDCGAGLAPW